MRSRPVLRQRYKNGVVGATPSCSDAGLYSYFERGALIGVSQTQGSLSIVSFNYNATDSKTPVAEITYTLLP